MPKEQHRHRSLSPRRPEKRSRYRSRSPNPKRDVPKRPLPLGAQEISRHDLSPYRPMFALYLDIQKQIDIEDLDENELKGRWKSFVGKWNRAELAEGWYDPQTLDKARASVAASNTDISQTNDLEEDEDEYGPALPSSQNSWQRDPTQSSRAPAAYGASIPSLHDLRNRDEQTREDSEQARHDHFTALRQERRLDRKEQNTRLDELAPRAEPGTRERQIEKKREVADSNRAFAASKEGGGDVELRDADVMGDEDSLGDLKRMKRENERRKNEREIRKEEILRARKAEREARLAGLKEKEDRTMQMFKEIARARFGGGGSAG